MQLRGKPGSPAVAEKSKSQKRATRGGMRGCEGAGSSARRLVRDTNISWSCVWLSIAPRYFLPPPANQRAAPDIHKLIITESSQILCLSDVAQRCASNISSFPSFLAPLIHLLSTWLVIRVGLTCYWQPPGPFVLSALGRCLNGWIIDDEGEIVDEQACNTIIPTCQHTWRVSILAC